MLNFKRVFFTEVHVFLKVAMLHFYQIDTMIQ
jgi:hypothetical protein